MASNAVIVKDDSKKEFKDFIALLSSEICKSILQSDLNKFIADFKGEGELLDSYTKYLKNDIEGFETQLGQIKKLTDGFNGLSTSVENSNDMVKTAYQKLQGTEQQIIQNIEHKYIDAYNKLQQNRTEILEDLNKNQNEFTKRTTSAITQTNENLIRQHLSQLMNKQTDLNQSLLSNTEKTIARLIPDERIKNIETEVSQSLYEIKDSNKSLKDITKQINSHYLIVQSRFSKLEDRLAKTEKTFKIWVALLLSANIVSIGAIIFLIVKLVF